MSHISHRITAGALGASAALALAFGAGSAPAASKSASATADRGSVTVGSFERTEVTRRSQRKFCAKLLKRGKPHPALRGCKRAKKPRR